jgi:tetratricopeptide (TPR) repeat protein
LGAKEVKKERRLQEWMKRAETLKGKKKFQEALKVYNEALEAEGEDFELLKRKGDLLRKPLGDFKAAIECYDKALKIKKDDDILEKKGDSLRKLGEFARALECYNAVSVRDYIILVLISGAIMVGVHFLFIGVQSAFSDDPSQLSSGLPGGATIVSLFVGLAYLGIIAWFIYSIYKMCRYFFVKGQLRKKAER